MFYNREHAMDNVIAEDQKWKQQGQQLRTHARQAMEARFRDLLLEAAQVAQEYQHDFGVALKPPASITAFRYKAPIGKTPAKAKKSAPAPEQSEPAANPKLAPLEKKLALAREKLAAAKAAGKPTRNLEDRIYEIEDAIRLANQAA